MATTYPVSKQSWAAELGTNALSTSQTSGKSHADIHTDVADTIEAIQDYVGYNASLTTPGAANRAFYSTSATASNWGILPILAGGTGTALVASNGGIIYSTASALAVLAGTATAGQMLQSGASGAPTWSTSTYPATNAINTLLYASAANVISALATANSAYLVTSSTGVPTWTGSATNGQLVIGSTGATPVLATLTAGANITVTNAAGSITIAATAATPTNVTFTTDFANSARHTNTLTGGGTNTWTAAGQNIGTSATATSSSDTDWKLFNVGATGNIYGGSPAFGVRWAFTALGTDLRAIFCLDSPTVSGTTITMTDKHIGFKVVRAASGTNDLFASQANGTTETASASLTTVANFDSMVTNLKVNGSTSVDYYWRQNEGAQSSATNLTTNMPAAVATAQTHFAISNMGVATSSTINTGGASFTI